MINETFAQSSVTTTTKPKPPSFDDLVRLPYSSQHDGGNKKIDYLVDGLLKSGSLSLLAAKPKQGKSNLSRYIAVRVSKGAECLGHLTSRAEVLIVNLEDAPDHTDDCLTQLGWVAETDSRILFMDATPSSKVSDNIEAIEEGLAQNPGIRLVVVDTLAKFLRVGDLNDYSTVLDAVRELRNLAVRHPHVHILALVHCKKVGTEDPFDSILGSSALRGEADTNIMLYQVAGQRLLTTESRRGRPIEPTLIIATLRESQSDGAMIISDFALGKPFSDWKSETSEKCDKKLSIEAQIITLLKQAGGSATRKSITDQVKGRHQTVSDTISKMVAEGVLTLSGVLHSKSDPPVLSLVVADLEVNEFTAKFAS